MTTIQIAGIAAAIALVAAPQLLKAVKGLPWRLPSAGSSGPTVGFNASVDHLAKVRLRLIETAALEDAQKAAIEVLTLALVGGSDK